MDVGRVRWELSQAPTSPRYVASGGWDKQVSPSVRRLGDTLLTPAPQQAIASSAALPTGQAAVLPLPSRRFVDIFDASSGAMLAQVRQCTAVHLCACISHSVQQTARAPLWARLMRLMRHFTAELTCTALNPGNSPAARCSVLAAAVERAHDSHRQPQRGASCGASRAGFRH